MKRRDTFTRATAPPAYNGTVSRARASPGAPPKSTTARSLSPFKTPPPKATAPRHHRPKNSTRVSCADRPIDPPAKPPAAAGRAKPTAAAAATAMYSANHWGGSFEIAADGAAEDDHSRNMDLDRGALSARQHQLDETQQSWLLGPPEAKKKDKYVDLGCVVVKRKLLWWVLWTLLAAFILIGLPVIIAKSIPKKKPHAPPPDQYTDALHKALLFFNAQKCQSPLHPVI